ncbi:HD-GYP domain-containing protein [Janibacter anophelis]|uniref:HD-GYP domain-containing protein n=1 Tax=Janibacter anophelis TaxID=319054 RepID=UPI000DEF9187|nr:HD domain-containing phosphohydrolase [Janibacter anophelis]
MVAYAVSGLPHRLGWMVAMLVVAFMATFGRPQAIGAIQMSVSGIVQIASIPLLGPVGAALVGAIPVVVDRNEPLKRLFNISQRTLFLLAGALAYHVAGGSILGVDLVDAGPVSLAVAMTAAAVAAAGVNAFLLAGALQRSSAGSLRAIGFDLVKQVVPAYASYGLAAYLLVILWAPAGLDWASILFFVPPLLAIQWGLHQHASLWATRHEVLTPFVTSLDLRRPGAAEEAELAAGAAAAMATGLGLRPVAVDNVTTAARLRDVGMLALDGAPPAIVRRDHAAAAREVVGAVSFLEPTLTLIDAHHERIDGHGHPDGLAGSQIPFGARILAVADTWAHLVAEGWSAPDAVDHCESVAGQSLDRGCVAALRRALERDQLPGRPT